MTKPYAYQRQDAALLEELKGRAVLGHEPGLGKSYIALRYLQRHPELRPALVICFASLKWNWQREAKKHFNMKGVVLEGTKPHRPKGDLLIINYEILKPWMATLLALKLNLVIVDEAHACCHPQSLRSGCTTELCNAAKAVIPITGTPLPNRPADLWNVVQLCRRDMWPEFWDYAQEFCDPKWDGHKWTFKGATNLDKLHKQLNKVLIRRLKADVLPDLPSVAHNIVLLDMAAKSSYRKTETDFRTMHHASVAELRQRLTALKKEAAFSKLESVQEWMDTFLDSGKKLVAFAIHKKVIGTLRKRYGKACVVVDGDTPMQDRLGLVDQFKDSNKIQLFLGNINAAGVGLNGLQVASDVALLELPWRPADVTQAIARCNRIGSTSKKVSAWYLLAHGTIEEKLCELLQRKQRIHNQVLDGTTNSIQLDIYDELAKEMLRRK